jgi:elongation factor Tu
MAYATTKKPGQGRGMVDRYVGVAVAGHVDAGKTTFTSAATRAARLLDPERNKEIDINKIDNAPEEKSRGITIVASHIPLFFENTEMSFTDCPGHVDYQNNMISGAIKCDYIILLVSAISGVEPQTRSHLSLASKMGIKKAFIVYNKMDMPGADELVELVEEEVDELLAENEVEKVFSIKISGVQALKEESEGENMSQIISLLKRIEEISQELAGDSSDSFKMSVEQKYSPVGQGVILTGRVLSGKINRGEEVNIIGMGKNPVTGKIKNIQTFGQDVEYATKGMDLGIQITNVNKENVMRGMMILAKDISAKIHSDFSVLLSVNESSQQGRNNKFGPGFEPQFIMTHIGVPVTGKIISIEGADYMMPGDIREVKVKLHKPLVMFPDSQLLVRESNTLVGQGRVVKLGS